MSNVRCFVAILMLLAMVGGCGSPASSRDGASSRSPVTVSASADRTATAAPTPLQTKAPTATATRNPDGTILVTVPAKLGFVQPGEDAIWGILEYPGVGREVVRIDPDSYQVEAVVRGLPILPDPVAPVEVGGSIWLVDDVAGSVTQYDAETGARIRQIEVGRFPIEPFMAFGDVWTINHGDDSITRIDVETGEPSPEIELPGSLPLTITAVADDLMLVNGPDGSPTTWMVDPRRLEQIGTYESTGCLKQYGHVGVAINGLVWRQNCSQTAVTIIDPRSGEAVETFPSPLGPYPPLYVDGGMWLPLVADVPAGQVGLALVDPGTHDVVRAYHHSAQFTEGWWFAAFDSWWRWGDEGMLRVPADTLRKAAR